MTAALRLKRAPTKLFVLFILPQLIFLLIAKYTQSLHLINVLNTILFALAVGIVTTFLAPTARIILSPWPLTKIEVMTLGIFESWLACIVFRSYVIVWRAMGRPDWLIDSDINSYAIYLYILAGLMHMLGSVQQHGDLIPKTEYVRIGVLVSIITFLAITGIYAYDQFSGLPFQFDMS